MSNRNQLRDHSLANMDLLRCFCVFAVVLIHVSTSYLNRFSNYVAGGISPDILVSPYSACLYNSLPRFAVPCFVMMTGALLLGKDEYQEYGVFYKKHMPKIIPSTVFFSIIYVLYRIIKILYLGGPRLYLRWMKLEDDMFYGNYMYHLWYMYMLIGLYFLVPIIIRFKNSVSRQNLVRVTVVFTILATISRWGIKDIGFEWNIAQPFLYVGYLLCGYVISTSSSLDKIKKRNITGVCLIVLGLLVEVASSFLVYLMQVQYGIHEQVLELKIVVPYAPLIVIASLLIFTGFTLIKVRSNWLIVNISELSFASYLIHILVWDVIRAYVEKHHYFDYMYFYYDGKIWIPVFTLLVFVISLVLAKLYNSIYSPFDRWLKKEINKK